MGPIALQNLLHALAISSWVHAGPATSPPEQPKSLRLTEVVGDCIAVGLGAQMKGVVTNAKVGLSAAAAAARVRSTYDEVILSAGTNNINQRTHKADDASITVALDQALANARNARLILILPSNDARRAVSAWASMHGVVTVPFQPGRGSYMAQVHPASYSALARSVEAVR